MKSRLLIIVAAVALVAALPALAQDAKQDSAPVPLWASAGPEATSLSSVVAEPEAPTDIYEDFSQTFAGSNVGGSIWNRPDSTSALSASCTACRYSVQIFRLTDASFCNIVSTQSYDGHIALYRTAFNPAAPLANLVDLDDDAELGRGSSRIPADLNDSSISLTAGTYFLVTSAYDNAGLGSFTNTLSCESAQPTQGACGFSDIPADQGVCLHNRFAVAINGVSNHPTNGIATPVRFGSQDSAFFWFYNNQNFEVMIKVLNACGVNGHWWVFAGALTNQAYHIAVYDYGHAGGRRRDYFNTLGTNAPATTDVTAFPCP